jgi:hypothetical protein
VTAYGFVRVRHDSTGDTAFERYVLPEIELLQTPPPPTIAWRPQWPRTAQTASSTTAWTSRSSGRSSRSTHRFGASSNWSTRIEAHLEQCRRCGMEAETYAQIKAALAAHRPDVPAESIDRLRQFGARLARGEHASES